MLVLPDADVSMAADAAISAAYGAAGQRCMAISVVVAVGSVADPLVDAIRQRIGRIKVGPGLAKGSEMGPLVTREHRDKVASYLDFAVEDGATVEVDGRKDAATQSDGFFLGASLVDHVAPGTRCYDNEIFGPVLSIVRVQSYPEALKSSTTILLAMGLRSLLKMEVPRGSSNSMLRLAWWASTCRFRCRWLTTASEDGNPRCLETFICMVLKACSSTLAAK